MFRFVVSKIYRTKIVKESGADLQQTVVQSLQMDFNEILEEKVLTHRKMSPIE